VEFDPPIKERSNKELFEIIENKKAWEPEAFRRAQSELQNRGVSVENQQNRRRSQLKYVSRVSKIKAAASYSLTDAIFIILIGMPSMVVFPGDNFFYSGRGYKKKNRQGCLIGILGLLFWALVIFIGLELS